ncbi:MAG: hypothetical protein Q7S04_01430 [Candidatus Moranbacteria bacterium]|nr:hypothetical protein [Candidatus Moranbacteria bacterium]
MGNKYLVEECFFLTPRDVGRRFDRIRKLGTNILEGRDDISYWFDDMSEPTCLFVSVDGHEPQKFIWEPVELTFGEAAYFHCGCGYKARKLYLLPSGNEFKCRKCHNLRYALSVLNSKSIAGRVIYRANRLHKLANSRACMGRIFYDGNFTKRFERFLGLCDKAGLEDIVRGANALKELVRG